jgi:hypothetical protein
MRHWLLPGIALIFLGGCGNQASSYITVYKEQVQAIEDLTKVLATVKDETTMAAARAKLKERFERFEQISKKAKALPQPSAEIKEQIEKELGPQILQAFDNYRKEGLRIQGLPGGTEFLEEMKKLR